MRKNLGVWIFFSLLLCARIVSAQNSPAAPATGDSLLLTAEGKVEAAAAGSTDWQAASTNQTLHVGDRLRTGLHSRATVRLSNLTVLRVNELTTLQIQPPSAPGKQSALDLEKGAAYFFSRERPTEMEFRTPLASGAIRGTEFNLAVADDGKTEVTLIDGAVALTNQNGGVNLASGEQGIVEPGQAPRKTASINAINIIQWSSLLSGGLEHGRIEFHRRGKTIAGGFARRVSLRRFARRARGLSDQPREHFRFRKRFILPQLLLSVGQVDQSETELSSIQSPLADALREVVAAVKFQTTSINPQLSTSTSLLADSYYLQSRSQLEPRWPPRARRRKNRPDFGFAWERLAELEFSFGHTAAALDALEKGLQLSPRNAEAIALKGFLLAAQNKTSEARKFFEQAIAVDGALGNAWLGRGLVRIHSGDADGGLKDLQVAAALEPNRSVLAQLSGQGVCEQR